MQDLLARLLADRGFRKCLPGPVATELGAVGAAHDALGAVEAHGRLDRARAERVAIHVHLRLADARRRQLLLRRVEQAAVVHALDLVGKVAAQIVDLDHRVGVVREVVGEAQCHHHRGQARLHVERAVAAARVVGVAGHLGKRVARPRTVVNEHDRTVPVRHLQQWAHVLSVLLREKPVSRHLRADHARQRQRALKLGGGSSHIHERQRGKHTEAPLVFLANP